MDPNANLKEQIELALAIARYKADLDLDRHPSPDQAERLAELVIALNDWIANGGFPPEKWERR